MRGRAVPVTDASLDLRARHRPAPQRIAQIVVRGHPLLRERADRPLVETGREAKVSIQHSVAVAFLEGAAGLTQFEDRCVADPAVRALRAKVAVEEDDSIPVESALVTLALDDGSSFTEHLRHGRGPPGRKVRGAGHDATADALAG